MRNLLGGRVLYLFGANAAGRASAVEVGRMVGGWVSKNGASACSGGPNGGWVGVQKRGDQHSEKWAICLCILRSGRFAFAADEDRDGCSRRSYSVSRLSRANNLFVVRLIGLHALRCAGDEDAQDTLRRAMRGRRRALSVISSMFPAILFLWGFSHYDYSGVQSFFDLPRDSGRSFH